MPTTKDSDTKITLPVEPTPAPPKVTDPPAAPPAAPPPAPKVPPPTKPEEDPDWLPQRLEQARRSMLRDLGVENVEDAKKGLAELKTRRESELSEIDRLKARLEEIEPKAGERDTLHTLVEAQATASLGVLTETQRKAVLDIAGDSPSKQLKTITLLAPTWADAKAKADQTVADAKNAPVPPPANTHQPGQAPPPANNEGGTNHLATFESLQKRNPMAAQSYYLLHQGHISQAQKARA